MKGYCPKGQICKESDYWPTCVIDPGIVSQNPNQNFSHIEFNLISDPCNPTRCSINQNCVVTSFGPICVPIKSISFKYKLNLDANLYDLIRSL